MAERHDTIVKLKVGIAALEDRHRDAITQVSVLHGEYLEAGGETKTKIG